MHCVQSAPTPKLPEMAIDRQEHHSNGTPKVLGVLHNATHTRGTSRQKKMSALGKECSILAQNDL